MIAYSYYLITFAVVAALMVILAVIHTSGIIRKHQHRHQIIARHDTPQQEQQQRRELSLLFQRPPSPTSVDIKVDSCPDESTLHVTPGSENEKYFGEYHQLYGIKESIKAKPLPEPTAIKDGYFASWFDPLNPISKEGVPMPRNSAHAPNPFNDGNSHVRHYTSVWDDNGYSATGPGRDSLLFMPPPTEGVLRDAETIQLKGNFVAFVSIFSGNYGHYIHDHLPQIAYLKRTLPQDTKFILMYNKKDQERLQFVDTKFERERVVWASLNKIYNVQGILYVDETYSLPVRLPTFTKLLREWLYKTHPPVKEKTRKTIVYYSRGGDPNVVHGRTVENDHEKDIINMIRQYMKKYKRSEKLVIYNGLDASTGEQMSLRNQFKLFRSASMIIGPHGSGLANLVWTDPSPTVQKSCDNRIKVLEFLVNSDLERVQDGGVGRSYYKLFAFPNWIDYHHLFYTSDSTLKETYINPDDFKLALDSMFGGSSSTRVFEEQKQQQLSISADTTTMPIATSFSGQYMLPPEVDSEAANVVATDPLYSFLANINDSKDQQRQQQDDDVPYFLHIAKSGGTGLKVSMSCMERTLTIPNMPDCTANDDELKVCKWRWFYGVNVDLTSKAGINRAMNLGFFNEEANDIPNLVMVAMQLKLTLVSHQQSFQQQLADGNNIPHQRRRLKLFLMLRDPIERSISNYYYRTQTEHEPDYNPEWKDWSMQQFYTTFVQDNIVMRKLLGFGGAVTWNEQHLNIAKEILRQKTLVLLTSHFNESVERVARYNRFVVSNGDDNHDDANSISSFQQQQQWPFPSKKAKITKCLGNVGYSNKHSHPTLNHNSDDYKFLLEYNRWDIELYKYAIELFDHQKALFN